MTIGQKINLIRNYKGYSRNSLSKLLGISQSSLYKYEKGIVIPKDTLIKEISDRFNIPMQYLTDDEFEITSFTLMRLAISFK